MIEKSAKKYLEIAKIVAEKGKGAVSKEELDFLKEVRKGDNEKALSGLKEPVKYYICDRSGASTKLVDGEYDKVTVFVRDKVGDKEYGIGIDEYFVGFEDFDNRNVRVIVKSVAKAEVWDEASDYIEKKEQEYECTSEYAFAEVTCVYKSEIK